MTIITNHAVTVKVNGIDKTAYVRKDALYARLSIGNKSDVAEVVFKNYNPTEQDAIQIYVNGTSIFGGYIISKSAEVKGVKPSVGSSLIPTVEWTVEAKDWSSVLDRITCNDTYTGYTDKAVIQALAYSYLPGFDSSTFVNILDSDLDISFIGISLRDAFDNLAARVGANWYIDAAKNIRWFNPNSPSSAAFNIDTYAPNNSTTFDILRNSLKYTVDASNIINRVIINGGTKTDGTKVTQTFTGDGSKKVFSGFNNIIDSLWSITYTDSGDNGYTTYGSFIGYAPGDSLLSAGGGFTVVVGADRKSIYIEGNSGLAPKNGSTITVEYYYKQGINFTKDNLESQGRYNAIFTQSIVNKDFSTEAEAEELAESILTEHAYGKASIRVDVNRYGLLPGTLIDVKIPEVGIGNLADTNFLGLENEDILLLENNDSVLLQSDAVAQTFLIQEVQYTCVTTGQGQFMIVANVTMGKFIRTIIDDLSKVQDLKTNAGSKINDPSITKLSNISSNLGEVAVGRANFTDGGTARFNWGTPNGATGVVVGLEDQGANAYGAMYVYDSGNTKVKIGRLNDEPTVGGIQPTGWGIVTTNGYFSGIVTASELYGGTVATKQFPINSANPGIWMDSTGLYAYGTAGLSFRLSTNPAIKPYFSSGTIENVVYEVTTASVIRTGTATTVGRVQIDNSGIFAWNSSNVLKFSVDATTGKLTATDGTFSGTVSGSYVSGGTVVGGNGTVTIDGSGMFFTATTGTAALPAASLIWKRSGTSAISIGGASDGSFDYLSLRTGVFGSKTGRFESFVYDANGTARSELIQTGKTFTFTNVHSGGIQISQTISKDAIGVYRSIVPWFTYGTVNLGSVDTGFRYIYLRDASHNHFRLEISSGTLLITAV